MEFDKELIECNCEVVEMVDFDNNMEVVVFKYDVGVGDSESIDNIVGDNVIVAKMSMGMIVKESVALKEMILVEVE